VALHFLSSYTDFLLNNDANETVAEFVREKIYSIVKDPDTAKKLLPKQVIGCKRLCLDSGYYETFNRPNVSLVDVSTDPIERITAHGLVAGGERPHIRCLGVRNRLRRNDRFAIED
jgi:cation diffusion facilitator CzcD-associated flavoprotein CzcO